MHFPQAFRVRCTQAFGRKVLRTKVLFRQGSKREERIGEIIGNMSKRVQELEDELNQEIQRGYVIGAFEKFYAEDVVMQENALPPCCGKPANRDRVRQWADTVSQLHAARLIGSAVSGDRAYSEWEYDVTYKNGKRHEMNEVAVRQWQDGKVIFERFYWDPTTYPYKV